MERLRHQDVILTPEQLETIDDEVNSQIASMKLEDNMEEVTNRDMYSNVYNIFGNLYDKGERGDEQYSDALGAMLQTQGPVDKIDWMNIPEDLEGRLKKLFGLARLLYKMEDGITTRIATKLNAYDNQFSPAKKPLDLLKTGFIDLVFLKTIQENQRHDFS